MNLWSLDPEDLTRLNQYTAVELFRKLLWAESTRVGIARYLIDVPSCINVGDEGLDALIPNASSTSDDVIPSGYSGFQIKSSDLEPKRCRKELHVGENCDNPLKTEVQNLIDNNGTYILVLFTCLTVPQKKRRCDAIIHELGKYCKKPKVRLYHIDNLVSFAQRFPGLSRIDEGLPFEIWAKKSKMREPKIFVTDELRANIIKEIRQTLRGTDTYSPIIRIMGLSGLGKTRLVYESLDVDDLKDEVVYLSADEFRKSKLLREFQLDSSLNAIIVVDECPLDDHESFCNDLVNCGSRLSFISISNEITRGINAPTRSYLLEKLPPQQTKELLLNLTMKLPHGVLDKIVDFSDGYPGFVTFFAQNYEYDSSSKPEDVFRMQNEILVEKLIAGKRIDSGSLWIKKTKKVLMGIALFDTVGYRRSRLAKELGDLSLQAKWVAAAVNVGWEDFQEIVKKQKERGIVQGEYYINVSPFPLRIYLVMEWWDIYGNEVDLNHMIESMPVEYRSRMLTSFVNHIPYITSTNAGKEFVADILVKSDLFQDGSLLNAELGSYFFLKLTEADPESALQYLKKTIGTWNKTQLEEFRAGRRNIVFALERIAIWKTSFVDAANLLLALAEAENEYYSNNATGVFIELFSSAPSIGASTEASPDERFPVLIAAIESNSVERQKIAIKALGNALKWMDSRRAIGAEYQGLRMPPTLWTPQTYKEIFDYYQKAWSFLEEIIDTFDGEVREDAVQALLEAVPQIAIRNDSLSDMVIGTIRKLSAYSGIDKGKLIRIVSNLVRYASKKMPDEVLEKWTLLERELVGSGFSNMLRRYIELDLLRDSFPDNENYDVQHVTSTISKLAQEVTQNQGLLQSEYIWLTTDRAKRGYQFGYELGIADEDFSLLPELLESYRHIISGSVPSNTSFLFLGGYLKAMSLRRKDFWEETLDNLAEEELFAPRVPELTSYSGMSERAAKRILELARESRLNTDELAFIGNSDLNQISESTFKRIILCLLQQSSKTKAATALDLVYKYYCANGERAKLPKKRRLPKNLTLQILQDPLFWTNKGEKSIFQQIEYEWVQLASSLIDQYPKTSNVLAEKMLQFFGNKQSISGSVYPYSKNLLAETIRRDPHTLWKKIVRYLGPPIDERAFALKEWLRGERGFESTDSGALQFINPVDIWEWIDRDVEKRAWYLATFVPPYIEPNDERSHLVRELLIRYGNREDVRSNFSCNYSSEAFWGSPLEKFKKRKDCLLELKKQETDSNIITWIEEYISILDEDIEREQIREERGDFGA